MGQAEIEKILKKNRGKWISTNQLRIKLNQSSSLITKALNKMFQYREVERKEIPITKNTEKSMFSWRIK